MAYNTAATQLATGSNGARVNFGSGGSGGNTYGQTYTTHHTTGKMKKYVAAQPAYTTEVREVRHVPETQEVRRIEHVPQTTAQEVRRIEHVSAAAPVATSQVQRIDHTQ